MKLSEQIKTNENNDYLYSQILSARVIDLLNGHKDQIDKESINSIIVLCKNLPVLVVEALSERNRIFSDRILEDIDKLIAEILLSLNKLKHNDKISREGIESLLNEFEDLRLVFVQKKIKI